MRFSLQPEQRPDLKMVTLTIDEILSVSDRRQEERPPLEHYFSPTRKESFLNDFRHYLNSGLLKAKNQGLNFDEYLLFVLIFQFTAPLLRIPVEKEFGLFYRIIEKQYNGAEIDLSIHFTLEQDPGEMIGEEEALEAYRHELDETYEGSRSVKGSVQKRLKSDAINAIMNWQKEKSVPSVAEAFGRSVVIPAFFEYTDKKLVRFYRSATEGISYRVAVPEGINKP